MYPKCIIEVIEVYILKIIFLKTFATVDCDLFVGSNVCGSGVEKSFRGKGRQEELPFHYSSLVLGAICSRYR